MSCLVIRASRKPAGPLNMVPSGRTPEESIGSPFPVDSRQPPRPSKFSSAKPSGSIILWQAAQVGLDLCNSMRWRMVKFLVVASSFNDGTFGGGGGECAIVEGRCHHKELD